jgi:tetratricopeptide (TPR) repeat protein
MTRQPYGRQMWMLVLPVVVALAVAAPAAAQSGQIRGVVKDAQGKTVEGADVTIEEANTARQWKTKSDKRGEFMQIGLRSGSYKVTATKEGVGTVSGNVQVSLSKPATPELRLVPAGVDASAAGSPEALAKSAALQKAFNDGVAANSAKNYDEALAKFNEALGISDKCAECYYNIGVVYSEQKKNEEAETAFKKAIELKSDYADAYNGLANVYNAERKFDEAGAASAKAAEISGAGLLGGGGGSADTLARQAMILFNSGKGADAKPIAQQALALDPNNADAHFIMGMILLTDNPAQAKTELESYLKLTTDQSSQNAATAKSLIPELDKMIQKP